VFYKENQMPRAAVRPGDVTGREKARLEKEAAVELEARRGEITLMAEAQRAENLDVVDLTNGPIVAPEVIEVVEVVDVKRADRELRVNTDLEQVTFGAGNHYDFQEGRRYKVPADLYDHLDEKGYVWH